MDRPRAAILPNLAISFLENCGLTLGSWCSIVSTPTLGGLQTARLCRRVPSFISLVLTNQNLCLILRGSVRAHSGASGRESVAQYQPCGRSLVDEWREVPAWEDSSISRGTTWSIFVKFDCLIASLVNPQVSSRVSQRGLLGESPNDRTT